ncbi:MAG: NAD(P)H-hydrate dehydratase [Fidelibacterota bacterium]
MKILSSDEARRVDGHTIKILGIPGETLMGRAGMAVAGKARKILGEIGGNHVAVVCGKGNNGGDGFSAAVRLHQFGTNLGLFSTVSADRIQGDADLFHRRCKDLALKVEYEADPEKVDLSAFDLLIDGLLGTGIQGEVKGKAVPWIEKINGAGLPVLSVDIPSGVSADTGQVLGTAVRARSTVTMGYLKQGLVMQPGADLAGDLEVADIGYPDRAFDVLDLGKETIDESLALANLTKPRADTYKHRQGKVLVVAGSKGYTGALCMVAEGALRSGAGLVIAAVPESLNHIVEAKLTEVITAPLPDRGEGRVLPECLKTLESYLDWCHVVAIGPGLGTGPEQLEFVTELFRTCPKPLVIDADALRVFHDNFELFKAIENTFVLTPHQGEAAALFGVEKGQIQQDPFQFVHESARTTGSVFVLKGAPTLVGDGEKVVANTTGHQGLATGGSGDVLTGIIAGFLAQGMDAFTAAQVGVFIHGKTGDTLLESHGYRGLVAGDLLTVLPSVLSVYERG